MEKGLVSIIVPCYNGEQFVDRCMESIIQQDYQDVEVVVVDDGSTDGSKEKILAWAEKFDTAHKSLKYVYQENKGISGAINTGLKIIDGEYLSLIDIDDEFLAGCFSERVSYLNKNPEVNVVRSNGYVLNGDHRWMFAYDEKMVQPDIFRLLLRGETYNWAGSYMIRTSALFDFYPEKSIYPSRFGQNLQLLLPMTYQKACGNIPKAHMNYIQQPTSLSQTANPALKKERSLRNADGFLDIRLHMIEEIVPDESEKESLRKDVYEGYHRSLMLLASSLQDRALMKESFLNLAKYATPSCDDKIMYGSVCSKPYWILMRVLKKCRLAK